MAGPIYARRLNLKPGDSIRLVGDILPNARRFVIDLGKDGSNIGLRFSPNFDYERDYRNILCNSMEDGAWDKGIRHTYFPFVQGTTVEILIEFKGTSFEVKLPDGFHLSFPNRTTLTTMDSVAVYDDIKMTTLELLSISPNKQASENS
ncbi:galectin-1-like [Sminthopsis crassicaudata]|uniref:galectin-1-like n=1 Tax=Sminthopsis crassicaudata TaxID=9301 RepID=UPI003D686B68